MSDQSSITKIDNSLETVSATENSLSLNKQISNCVREVIAASPTASQAIQNLAEGEKYVLDLSSETLAGLKDGTLTFIGEDKASIINSTTKKITELPNVKLDTAIAATSVTMMMQAMQMAELQKQLNDIEETIERVEQKCDYIIKVQHGDRIAEYKTGIELFQRAKFETDLAARKAKLDNAKNSLIGAIHTLEGESNSLISTIKNYYDDKKNRFNGMSLSDVDNALSQLNEDFSSMHKAVEILVKIDAENQKYKDVEFTLNNYKSFIEKTIINNNMGRVLYELDRTDMSMDGVWKNREMIPELLCNCSQKLLSDGIKIYIDSKGEVEYESLPRLQPNDTN